MFGEKHLVERQKSKVETSSLRTLEIMPRNLNVMYVLEFPLRPASSQARLKSCWAQPPWAGHQG
jgi:hypothetical protein